MEICVHTFALTPSVHHPGRDKGKVDVPIYIKQKLICPKSGWYRCLVLGANFNVCLVVENNIPNLGGSAKLKSSF